MHAEDLFVHDRGYREAVEAVRERFPQLDVVTALAWTNQRVMYVTRRGMGLIILIVSKHDGSGGEQRLGIPIVNN